jgi:hypothetical protein
VPDFADVVENVRSGSMEFVGAEPRKNAPCLGCHRAFFRVHVSSPAYDAFFNSPVGYRAQYCISLENGRTCNRELLDALERACLAAAVGKEPADFPVAHIVASLRATRAKIWIDENDLTGLDGVHIEYQPWLAKAAFASTGTLAEQAARSSVFAGLLAPIGAVLELKGGWIDPRGTECLDPAKAARDAEIRDYGFT